MRSAISRCLTVCAITCLITGSNAAVADETAVPAVQPASVKTETPEAAQPASPAKPDATDDRDAVRPISRYELCETLAGAAKAHRLPVPFFIRLIWQESRFNAGAVSPAGAQGVAQFMPRVAEELGLDNPFDPAEAVRTSARLLRALVDRFGNLGLAAAAYNGGPKRVSDWLAKRGRLPQETRNYVNIITGHGAERWVGERSPFADPQVPAGTRCHQVAAVADAVAAGKVAQAAALAEEAAAATAAAHKAAAEKAALAKAKPSRVARLRETRYLRVAGSRAKPAKVAKAARVLHVAKATKGARPGKATEVAEKAGKRGGKKGGVKVAMRDRSRS